MANVQYIDYFGSRKQVPSGYQEVSIARGGPAWFEGGKLQCFAPSWNLVHSYREGLLTDEAYTNLYYNELSSRTKEIQEVVDRINNGENFVFKCHCGKGKFCHRFLVKRLLEAVGIEVQEL